MGHGGLMGFKVNGDPMVMTVTLLWKDHERSTILNGKIRNGHLKQWQTVKLPFDLVIFHSYVTVITKG